MRGTIRQRLFKECYENNIPLYECPSFLFVILGFITIMTVVITFFLALNSAPEEIVIVSVCVIAGAMIVVGNLIINGVDAMIKEKRRAELEQKKVEAIIQNLTDGLIMFDNRHTVLLVNSQAAKLLNVKINDLIGKSATDKKFLKDYPLFKQITKHFPRIQESQKDRIKVEKATIGEREAEKKILKITTAPVWGDNNQLLGSVKTIQDITREDQINSMKSEFISIASHQLRTPLSSLKWFMELLLNGRAGKLNSEQEEMIQQMDKNNERMIELVENLLNISRIEGGKAQLEIAEVNASEFVEDVIKDIKPQIKKKHIELISNIDANLKTKCDPKQAKMVVQNLVDNAVKYTIEKGKIKFNLQKVNYSALENINNFKKKKRKSDGKYQEWILFSVKDSGIGIPLEDQQKVFSKFYRSRNAKTLQVHGTGLGLHISEVIADRHDGHLWFESKESKGSTFYFTLPIK
ncbi:MAG: ATP-binding protein [bacterium]